MNDSAKTNLDDLYVAYDETGRLCLADVRPVGFLIEAKA
jgi:hypothetical protein